MTPTVALAATIIGRIGEPVRTEMLIREMQAAGHVFEGRDPPNNLASVLGKSGIIKSVQIGPSKRDDRGWWFTNRPAPPLELYEPPAMTLDMSHNLVSILRSHADYNLRLSELLVKSALEIDRLSQIIVGQTEEIEQLKASAVDPMDVIRDYEERSH